MPRPDPAPLPQAPAALYPCATRPRAEGPPRAHLPFLQRPLCPEAAATHSAIRSLLAGNGLPVPADALAAVPADWPAAADYTLYGRWSEAVQELAASSAVGGISSAVRSLSAFLKTDASLAELLSEDDSSHPAYSLAAMLHADFPPTQFVVAGLIPVGLTVLAGRPKLGKSYLALQIAIAVHCGSQLFGREVPRARVLYLALEDTEQRLSSRIKQLVAAGHIDIDIGPEDPAADSHFAMNWEPFSGRGLQVIGAALDFGYKLLVIDTISRAAGRLDQMDPQEMTHLYSSLQRMAARHGAAILLVDHHRKSARTTLDPDPIDDILGSTAKGGVVDCALGLYRRHKEDEATLKLSGRDFGFEEVALKWDAQELQWTLGAQAASGGKAQSVKSGKAPTALRYTRHEQAALDAIGELGPSTLAQLAAHLHSDRSNLYRLLRRLCSRNVVEATLNTQGYVYTLTPPPPSTPPAALSPADLPASSSPHAACGSDASGTSTAALSPANDNNICAAPITTTTTTTTDTTDTTTTTGTTTTPDTTTTAEPTTPADLPESSSPHAACGSGASAPLLVALSLANDNNICAAPITTSTTNTTDTTATPGTTTTTAAAATTAAADTTGPTTLPETTPTTAASPDPPGRPSPSPVAPARTRQGST